MTNSKTTSTSSLGSWFFVDAQGETVQVPQGSLQFFDPLTSQAILEKRVKPRDATPLQVKPIEVPEQLSIDPEAVFEALCEQAGQEASPLASHFRVLDAWLRRKKEEGLPRAWRSPDLINRFYLLKSILSLVNAQDMNDALLQDFVEFLRAVLLHGTWNPREGLDHPLLVFFEECGVDEVCYRPFMAVPAP